MNAALRCTNCLSEVIRCDATTVSGDHEVTEGGLLQFGHSRNAYHVERVFNRLKSRVHIAPLFVKLNDQIEGLTYLLTLGVRVLTVMEFVLRRSLHNDQATLPGLHPENKKKMTDKPTAERLLKAFREVSLTIIKNTAGEEILRRLTPLSGL